MGTTHKKDNQRYYNPIRKAILNYKMIEPGEKIITLDPGMAFGTGTHPTTRLTLQALEVTLHGDETVLDVGTGSGVLSIASKYLGAKEVHAFDLDEVAVRAAKENMDLNPIASDVKVSANDFLPCLNVWHDKYIAVHWQIRVKDTFAPQWDDIAFNITIRGIDYQVLVTKKEITLTANRDSQCYVGSQLVKLPKGQAVTVNY